jgi:chromosome segregation protein
MYLKTIEIQGFKSFANRINFQFHSGITGIVGPNGSGKSNVTDAVRWVLGEQRSKQLRGASMQDVIFSGTEMRKPLSYAFVSITFDNSSRQLSLDYDEVTVARRIYRSGESEYLLNGTPCRLKDISELFYDTGIGKEGYSIIGQSQIDKILSGKPEERRELFDEAAGIVKFKRRKEAAQKKLEDEKLNLLRVTDIISELERQKEPLERQAETARVYLRKKEELKDLDINIFLREHNRLTEQIKEVAVKRASTESELAATSRRYDEMKMEYERLDEHLQRLEEAIEEARAKLTDTGLLRGKLTGEIAVLQEQIKAARGNEEHLRQRLSTVQGEIDVKNIDRETILTDKKAIDAEIAAGEASRNAVWEALQAIQGKIEEHNNQIEDGNKRIIETLNARAAIKAQLGSFDAMLEQIDIRKTELANRLELAKADEKEQEAEIEKRQKEFAEISEQINQLNEAQTDSEEKLYLLREELAGKDRALRDTQVLYHQEKSRLEALQNLAERYEGYGGAVKRVMEEKGKERGIVGVVADIIKVEKKYETAIEIALGGNIQNIVTRDEATAKRMIGLLKEQKAGRATFLPLTNLVNEKENKNPAALQEKGVVGMADELVATAPEYAAVAISLLGRIMVVDNMDNALAIAGKYGQKLRIVTLDGELLTPGGAISGGTFKNQSSLLGRHRETEEAEKNIKEHLAQIDSLMQGIDETKANRNRIRLELEEIKAKLQSLLLKQNTARLGVMQATEKKEAAEEGSAALLTEEQEIAGQITEIGLSKEAILKELGASEVREKEIEEEIKALQKEVEATREEEAERQVAVSEQEVKAEKLLQMQGFHQQNIERIDSEIARLSGELAEIRAGLEKNKEDVRLKQENITEIEQTILASHTTQGDTESSLKEDIARKEELAAKQKNFFGDREKLAEEKSVLDKEVYRLVSQNERLQEMIEGQINYMWEEYEITLSQVAALQEERAAAAGKAPEVGAMKKQISALKEEIKELGDVNVNAIEDYRSLLERYTFLTTQHDDLVAAEETLNGIIEELDAAMRRQFREKFAEIEREYDRVFKELFGGGKGTLEMMEDEDMLEAGIRIIAQPPGKKLQNMMQLSGGEKALTAIALIFAIQNLKPSPFCLLDEIEAALDENNVTRFARYLQKLAKHTQFIVITHRRGTMEKADRLYGITMQEKGVSALVSVKLVERELED